MKKCSFFGFLRCFIAALFWMVLVLGAVSIGLIAFFPGAMAIRIQGWEIPVQLLGISDRLQLGALTAVTIILALFVGRYLIKLLGRLEKGEGMDPRAADFLGSIALFFLLFGALSLLEKSILPHLAEILRRPGPVFYYWDFLGAVAAGIILGIAAIYWKHTAEPLEEQ